MDYLKVFDNRGLKWIIGVWALIWLQTVHSQDNPLIMDMCFDNGTLFKDDIIKVQMMRTAQYSENGCACSIQQLLSNDVTIDVEDFTCHSTLHNCPWKLSMYQEGCNRTQICCDANWEKVRFKFNRTGAIYMLVQKQVVGDPNAILTTRIHIEADDDNGTSTRQVMTSIFGQDYTQRHHCDPTTTQPPTTTRQPTTPRALFTTVRSTVTVKTTIPRRSTTTTERPKVVSDEEEFSVVGVAVGCAIGAAVIIAAVVVFFCCCRKKEKSEPEELGPEHCSNFPYHTSNPIFNEKSTVVAANETESVRYVKNPARKTLQETLKEKEIPYTPPPYDPELDGCRL